MNAVEKTMNTNRRSITDETTLVHVDKSLRNRVQTHASIVKQMRQLLMADEDNPLHDPVGERFARAKGIVSYQCQVCMCHWFVRSSRLVLNLHN